MRALFVVFVVVSRVLGFAATELRVTSYVTKADVLKVSFQGTSGPVEAREFEVVERFSNSKEIAKTFIVIFEPRSRFFIWTVGSSSSGSTYLKQLEYIASRSALAVANNRMVWFQIGHPSLAVIESSKQAFNLDDACERSLQEATTQLPLLQTNEARQFIYVEIGKALADIGRKAHQDFFAPFLASNPGPFPVAVQANYTGSDWEISVAANLRAKVILGNCYDVIKVEQISGEGPAAQLGSKAPWGKQ
jgi:hypothetical protein